MTLFKPGSSGAPVVKFEHIGDHVHGVILAIEETQQTTMKGELKTFDDGKPMMQGVVTLETDEGEVRVFLKGAKGNEKSGIGAVRAAVERAGASDLEVGGTLDVEFIGEGVARRGESAPKEYHAAYAAPAEDDGE